MIGDVRERSAWEAALDSVDAVIHLAAYQDYLPDFAKFFHVNCVGTALMYEIIVEKKLPIKRSSSLHRKPLTAKANTPAPSAELFSPVNAPNHN